MGRETILLSRPLTTLSRLVLEQFKPYPISTSLLQRFRRNVDEESVQAGH